MNFRERMVRTYVGPAVEEISEWGGPKGHHITTWHVERYIWRTEDLPSYIVPVTEALNTPLTGARPFGDLETRRLEYIPTGRIMYDNTRPVVGAVLFEYRLKDARELRKPLERSAK